MSVADERIKRLLPENREIYNAWRQDCERRKIPSNSIKHYISAVTEFLALNADTSVLHLKDSQIDAFLNSKKLKLTRRRSKLDYLKKFLVFVDWQYKTDWDFTLQELKVHQPYTAEIEADIEHTQPLTAKELIKLYEFFKVNIYETRWLESYVVFRLMYDHGLDKYSIAKINTSTYDSDTGKFRDDKSASVVQLDDELILIIKSKGLNIIPKTDDRVYQKLTDLEPALGHNLTQGIIWETRKQIVIRCPECGKSFKNDPGLFGYVRTDLLNLGTMILCKNCLENLP
jgi:hypothetical protein